MTRQSAGPSIKTTFGLNDFRLATFATVSMPLDWPKVAEIRERLPDLRTIIVVGGGGVDGTLDYAATTAEALTAARGVIASVGPVSFEADELEGPLRRLAEERDWKVGDLFMAIRVAVTGRTATPPLFDTLVALGRERTLARLDAAIARLAVTAG